jgi:RNA polymerase sigma-70 factor (sigma-E family)
VSVTSSERAEGLVPVPRGSREPRVSREYADFDDFARARMRALLRFAHVLTGDPERAADLVQDALERTLLAWSRVQHKGDPEAYVRRAIVNRHVSVWRRHRRERLVPDLPDEAYDARAGHDAALWAALGSLPPRQRAVLVLRFYEDLSEADAAALLGCSVGTVKSQTSRGLARLRAAAQIDEEGVATWR